MIELCIAGLCATSKISFSYDRFGFAGSPSVIVNFPLFLLSWEAIATWSVNELRGLLLPLKNRKFKKIYPDIHVACICSLYITAMIRTSGDNEVHVRRILTSIHATDAK